MTVAGLPGRLLNRPLTIKTAGAPTTDAYGNPIPGAWTDTDVLGYAEQVKSLESLKGQDSTTVEWKVWLPAATVITETDRIAIDGVTYQVDGQPEKVWNPRTATVSHIIVRLTGTKPGT